MTWKLLVSLAWPFIGELTRFAERAIPEPKSGEKRMESVLAALTPLVGKMLGKDPPRELLRGIVEAVLAGQPAPRAEFHCCHCCPKKEAVRAETTS